MTDDVRRTGGGGLGVWTVFRRVRLTFAEAGRPGRKNTNKTIVKEEHIITELLL